MIKRLALLSIVTALLVSCQQSAKYESVANDPMKSRIYTLDNGLKVYLSVNKDQPRIQTYIAVRVGGKNDPSNNTGLAHYLEHLMFKGTTQFGTSDYAKEQPLLDEIEQLYEVYRTKTDPAERKAIYHQIDSLSYEASKYAIANEYDKLMAGIGSEGTNAYTSYDVTCYTEDIPSNEVENWAKIQSNRFKDMVIRGFHTELEAVYEEKNISLTDDSRKMYETGLSVLFPNHPYGQQTVLGTQDHLKNPSITTIKNHFKNWYVPNNVAICMSGDFDPDEVISLINQYFGDWTPNPAVDSLRNALPKTCEPLTSPDVRDVYGPESDRVMLGWAFPGKNNKDVDYLDIIEELLYNGKAGLFDIDLNQAQKVLSAGAGAYALTDHSMFITIGMPKEGQSLDEVRELMLAEITKLKNGEFDASLLEAIINNMKRQQMQQLENNSSRARMFVEAFVNGTDWKDEVERIDRISKITKDDVVKFANTVFTDGYSCVYKHKGVDPNEKKIEKPAISPIETNRDKTSQFVTDILNVKVKEIEPVFVDFDKDMSVAKLSNSNELLYKQNDVNGLFSIQYRIARGSKADKYLPLAAQYIDYLGTSKLTPEQLQSELYRLACNISFSVNADETIISLSGLAENMKDVVALCESWMHDAQSNQTVYDNLVADELKARADAKLEQKNCFLRLRRWAMFGPVNESTNILSAQELKETVPDELLKHIDDLKNYEQTIVYYGPMKQAEFTEFIETNHEVSASPMATIKGDVYKNILTPENQVILAPYDAKNIYMIMYSNNGQKYDAALVPQIELFNEYFGGGMNALVFQELREARGLAYSASAYYTVPEFQQDDCTFYTYIISQNDKMGDCIDTFHKILEDMPATEASLLLAKEAIMKRIATQRTIKRNVLSAYIEARNHGLDYDISRDIYNKVQNMTLDELVNFQHQNVKGRTYTYLILGNEADLDVAKLQSLGNIQRVSLEEIFGY